MPLQVGSVLEPAVQEKEKAGEKPRHTCLHSQLQKTKFCLYHLKGACQFGSNCSFAHSCAELQATPDLRKTRLCMDFIEGSGCVDPLCPFAHGEEELRSTDMFYKKTLCIWNEKGKCRNGDQCRFAHGMVELRAHQGYAMLQQGEYGSIPKVSSGEKVHSGSNGSKSCSTGGYASSNCSSYGESSGSGSGGTPGVSERVGGRRAKRGSEPGSQDLTGFGSGSGSGASSPGEGWNSEPMKIMPTRSLLKAEHGTRKSTQPTLTAVWPTAPHKPTQPTLTAVQPTAQPKYDASLQAELLRMRCTISALAAQCSQINTKMQSEALASQCTQLNARMYSEALNMGWPLNARVLAQQAGAFGQASLLNAALGSRAIPSTLGQTDCYGQSRDTGRLGVEWAFGLHGQALGA